ncbi:MAG: D-hexose-6-phosphate mutarotase [Anaerolineales bacterium]|jgi:glucose-6-phosphate 1-epimerase|nr:D-hexose-6-phosphate mutarotase [Anaerolineales bacterium]
MPDLSIKAGIGGLPKCNLAAPDGAQAEIYLHGGHLTSWIPAGSEEQLFLSPMSEFKPQAAIRGGVPVLFPQFSVFGPLRKHGFARLQDWELHSIQEHTGLLTARLTLSENEITLQEWPYQFQMELAVTIGGSRLDLTLSVTNTGSQVFKFTTGLHTYLRVRDVSQVTVSGLQNGLFMDQTDGNQEKKQAEKLLAFEGEIDRIYYNPRPVLTLQEGLRQIQIGRRGFTDFVIWNPGAGARLTDLAPDSYRSFVCIEAGSIAKPVRLSPDESWQSTQTLTNINERIK